MSNIKQKGIYIEGLCSGDHYIIYKVNLNGKYKYRVMIVSVLSGGRLHIEYADDFKYKKNAIQWIDVMESMYPDQNKQTAYDQTVAKQDH